MEWEEFEAKIKRMEQLPDLARYLRGGRPPWLIRLLWKLKIKVRPPPFMHPVAVLVACIITATPLFYFIFYFISLMPYEAAQRFLPSRFGWWQLVRPGLIFGLIAAIATYIERKTGRIKIKWEDI